jgi:hypothetical protein
MVTFGLVTTTEDRTRERSKEASKRMGIWDAAPALAIPYPPLQCTQILEASVSLPALPPRIGACLVAPQNAKFFKIPRHIESLDACMKH